MTETYKWTDPTDNAALFEAYSTEYIDAQFASVEASIAAEVATLNATITTLDTTITNTINTNVASLNARIDNVEDQLPDYLPLAGGTMTGSLLLNADPVQDEEASTKKYTDDRIAEVNPVGVYLPLVGGVMNGTLNLGANPITAVAMRPTPMPTDAANIQFVNNAVSNAIGGGTGSPTFTNLDVTNNTNLVNLNATGNTTLSNMTTVANLTVTGAASFTGTINVNGFPVLTEATGDNRYLSRAGGTMTGPINMGDQNIVNLNLIAGTNPTANISVNSNLDMMSHSVQGVTMRATPASDDVVNVAYVQGEVTTINNAISDLNQSLPATASPTNPVITQDDLTDAIQGLTARILSASATGEGFATHAALEAGPYYYRGATTTPTDKDVAVVIADETAPAPFDNGQTKYEFDGTVWTYVYGINETPFTAAQNAAIDSGITASIVTQVTNNTNALSNLNTNATITTINQNIIDNATAITNLQNSLAGYLPLTGGTLTGSLTLNGNPVNANDAVTKAYADALSNLKLSLTGGTMTGILTLSGNPVGGNDATNKSYVDARSFTNVTITSTDPGAGSPLANGAIILVYTP